MNKKRVVITGLGSINALSHSVEALFQALLECKSGISMIESFDTTDYPVRIGGEIKDFNATDYIDHRDSKRMDRFTQLAMAAASNAVKDSGIDFEKIDVRRAGVIVGTGIGGIKEIEEQHIRLLNKGPKKVSPFCVPRLMANAASGNIAITHGLKGPNICVVSACASATHSIGEAYMNIAYGRSDFLITGGSEAALTPIGLASFCAAKSLSKRNDDPTHASRPFDRDRDGFILSEGAGILILEELEHAKKRNARIYAEVLGYGATDDGYHLTAPMPDGSGAAAAIKVALDDAEMNPDQVDYINAHGTSTQLNDIAESQAIRTVFGDHATKVNISSTKGCLGHSLGATGAIELIVCAKTIQDSVIPPTANHENTDEKCGLDMNFVPNTPKQTKVKVAMSNSLGFGGHNATVIIGAIS
jgi:3-oxoacyl-[acyl-carrier-protein] synthase II